MGLVRDSGQKVEVFTSFVSYHKDREKVFGDVLDGKEAFQGYWNICIVA